MTKHGSQIIVGDLADADEFADVQRRLQNQDRIVTEESNGRVAAITQNTSKLPSLVVVIDSPSSL
jgi:hypothetical protein